MSDKPSAFERLSTALNSSDLTFDPDHRTDLDYVAALGVASHRLSSVAGPLMRLHIASSPAALNSAYESVLALVRKFNAKKNWRLAKHGLHAVALHALSHHVDPTCPACHGRKFELQEDSPVLSTKLCRSCHGTGRRQVQKKHRDEINHVIAVLEQIDSTTERAVARLVR